MFTNLILGLHFDFDETVAAVDTVACSYVDCGNDTTDRCSDSSFHFHSFGNDELGAFGNSLAFFNQHFDYGAG